MFAYLLTEAFINRCMLAQLATELMTKPDWNARISTAICALQAAGLTDEDTTATLSAVIDRFYRKVTNAMEYRPSARLPSSVRVTLVKASDSSLQTESVGFDYGLNSLCDGDIDVRVVDGTHETFITTSDGASQVSSIISSA